MHVSGIGAHRATSAVTSPWLAGGRPTTPSGVPDSPPRASLATVEGVSLSSTETRTTSTQAGAALAMSMAMLALPSFAAAHEVVPPPSTQVTAPISEVRASSTRDAAPAGEAATSFEATRGSEAPGRSVSDLREGLQSFKSTIGAYTQRLNDTLNDHSLNQYRASGTLAGYTWKFDPLTFKVDPYVTTRISNFGVGVRGEVSALRGSIEKSDTIGEYARTQGVRAELYVRQEVGTGARLDLKGIKGDSRSAEFAGPRLEAFTQLRSDGTSWKQTYEFNAGASHDVHTGTALTYLRAMQRFENDTLARPWLGDGSRVRLELEQGVQVNATNGDVNPYYRAFAGAGKPVTLTAFGQEVRFNVEAGVQAQGNRDRSFEARPVVRARTHW